jgi:phospholipid/cholesterol/gamma-HCH transport system permease protein
MVILEFVMVSDSLTAVPAEAASLAFSRPDSGTLLITLAGRWTMKKRLPTISQVEAQLASQPPVRRVAFDCQGMDGWDSGLLTFMVKVINVSKAKQIDTDCDGLPEGVHKLLNLAFAVPERKGARRELVREPLLERVGKGTIGTVAGAGEMIGFIGEATLSLLRFVTGRARYRKSDLFVIMQECGAQALPIVSLISFLVGLILAFIGAMQLRQFGAQVYIANLVAIGMARAMGAMMTAIIMAGRTGAAFAAQLGTMTVNEEIDALSTMGIPAMDFLVLPRMLALIVMMPLLTLYSDLMGMLGGAFIARTLFDIGLFEYYTQTRSSVDLTDFAVGLINGSVYGVIVALSGCLRGIQSGRSASAVGAAATSAVVTAIVFIIVATAILTVIYDVLGI